METPSRFSYNCDGSTRVFPIATIIKGDNYCRVEVDGEIINDRTKYDIVNNSIVFLDVLDVPNGSQLDVLVVQSEEAIGRLSVKLNLDIVATNIANVNATGTHIANVNTVAGSIANVNATGTNILNVNTVANNMTGLVDVINNLPEVLLADDNAAVATTQAGLSNDARVLAESALATFTGQYHGALATAPTTGLDAGDLYFDTVLSEMRVYTGTVWKTAVDTYTRTEVNGKLVGFKNIIINGDKRVNQRVYAGGVLADGVYGYDRWRGKATGANIEQVIEQQNIRTGTYTISWVGGGTATVNGTAGLVSGSNLLITVAGNISVVVPKAATDVQLEPGTVATPFEQRPIGVELALCQRYYEKYIGKRSSAPVVKNNTSLAHRADIPFSMVKRVPPTMTNIVIVGTNVTGKTLEDVTTSGFLYSALPFNESNTWNLTGYEASAEL